MQKCTKYLAAVQKNHTNACCFSTHDLFSTKCSGTFWKALKTNCLSTFSGHQRDRHELRVVCAGAGDLEQPELSWCPAGTQVPKSIAGCRGMLTSPGENAKWLHIADILFVFLLFPSPVLKKFLETKLHCRLHLSNPSAGCLGLNLALYMKV